MHLSKFKLRLLKLLADGTPVALILHHLGISRECYHVHCHRLRKLTGLPSLLDAGAVARWLSNPTGTSAAPIRPPLTPRHHEVLRLRASGQSVRQVALSLGLAEQTVTNHANAGAKRLGITSRRGTARTIEIRKALARLDGPASADPMSDPAFQ